MPVPVEGLEPSLMRVLNPQPLPLGYTGTTKSTSGNSSDARRVKLDDVRLIARIMAAFALVVGSLALGMVADASCALPEPLPQRIARADAVVFGRVMSFEGGPIPNRRALIVAVQRVYKGSAVDRIFVSAGPGGEGGGAPGTVVATSVDYTAEQGSEHTFYLKQHSPAGFSTDACSGSHEGDLTADERAALGAGRAPDRAPGGVGSTAGTDRLIAVAVLGAALGATFYAFRRSLAPR